MRPAITSGSVTLLTDPGMTREMMSFRFSGEGWESLSIPEDCDVLGLSLESSSLVFLSQLRQSSSASSTEEWDSGGSSQGVVIVVEFVVGEVAITSEGADGSLTV